MKLHFDREPAADFDALVGRYGPRDLGSPTRSTVPLLSLLRHGGEVWRRIVAELGMDADAVSVHVEYTVASPRGRGRKSHTDAMLISGERACAVEAKWTEPPYATVEAWLARGTDGGNRREVMKGWLSLLQRFADRPLRVDDFAGAVYQTVYRAATACALERAPAMAYAVFATHGSTPKGSARLRDDLARLHGLLGSPAGFPFWLLEITAMPTPSFERIRHLPGRTAATAEAVRRALRDEPLFYFPGYRAHHIGGSFQ